MQQAIGGAGGLLVCALPALGPAIVAQHAAKLRVPATSANRLTCC